jgi:hypothetical protein
MRDGLTDLGEVRFHPPGLASEVTREGQWIHGLQGANRRTIPIATAPAGLRVDGFEEGRHGQVPALGFHGGASQRTRCALPCGTRVSADACGARPLLLQARPAAVDGLVPGLLIGLGTPLIHPGGGILPHVAPALVQDVRVEPPIAVADPRALLPVCLRREARPGGGPGGPSLHVRAMWPLPAP